MMMMMLVVVVVVVVVGMEIAYKVHAYDDTDADDVLVIMARLVMSQPPPLPPDDAAAAAAALQQHLLHSLRHHATCGRPWTKQGAIEKLQASGRPTWAEQPTITSTDI